MEIIENARRNILLIIVFVSLLGVLTQMTRSQLVFKISNHTNEYEGGVAFKQAGSRLDFPAEGYAKDRFLIIIDPDDPISGQLKDNIAQVIRYMKKEYDVVPVAEAGSLPNSYLSVITTFASLAKFPNAGMLEQYVSDGGNVFLAMRPEVDDEFLRMYRKLGIYAAGSMFNSTAVHFASNVLLKGTGETFDSDFLSNSALFVSLEAKCRVYATTNRQVPLLWDVGYGQGKFMVFNGTILQAKINRGIIAGALSLLNQEQDFIFPVMNMKLAYIDDFPAPFPEGSDPRLHAEYGRNNQRFFREIWWPDMLKAAQRDDLKYTGVLIEIYNNKVIPPFADSGGDKTNLIMYGRELLKNGGELGIHGYNHQSLETNEDVADYYGYNVWSGISDMEEALTEVNRFARSVFPKYVLRTYVPPSNVLSPQGREAIKQALPDVKIISSVYHEDPARRAYAQEYAVGRDGLVELPRITSGYEFNDENRWALMNAVTSIGVFSHFVHPDDIFDADRNGNKSWKDLSKEYSTMTEFVKRRYGWLKALTASEGAARVENYAGAEVAFKRDGRRIEGHVNGFGKEADFFLRTNKKIGSLNHCTVTRIDAGVYLVHALQANFALELDDGST